MNKKKLFKYRSVNKNLVKSLIHSQIYFSNPDKLNDPYDCQVELFDALDRAILQSDGVQKNALKQTRKGKRIFEQINSDIREFGVCSFSLTAKNHVLWTHYADEHKGICLMYKIPNDFIIDPANEIIGFSAVVYSNNAITEFFKNFAFPKEIKVTDIGVEALKKLLTSKDKDWKYEREARLIRKKSGSLNIPNQFLTQIIFGLRTSESDKSLVREIIESKYENVQFVQAKRGSEDFGASFIDI